VVAKIKRINERWPTSCKSSTAALLSLPGLVRGRKNMARAARMAI